MNPPKQLFVAFFMVNLAFPFLSNGQTYVSGNINEDTEWTEEGSPYIITSSVTIDSGAVLTIDKGVVVSGVIEEGVNRKTLSIRGSIEFNAQNNSSDTTVFRKIRMDFKKPVDIFVSVKFDSVVLINPDITSFNLEISNSRIVNNINNYDPTHYWLGYYPYLIRIYGNVTIDNTIFYGSHAGLYALAFYYEDHADYQDECEYFSHTINIKNSSFLNYQNVFVFEYNDWLCGGPYDLFVDITDNNFINTSEYVILNGTDARINATRNYWETSNLSEIKNLVTGRVDFSNPLALSNTKIPVFPSKNAFLIPQQESVFLGWTESEASEIAGYKVYRKKADSAEFILVVDIGNKTSYYTDQIEMDDIVGISAYNTHADGSGDFFEGNESYPTLAGSFSIVDTVRVTTSSMCRDSISLKLTPNFEFDDNYFVLQLSDSKGSFENALDLDSVFDSSHTLSSIFPDTLNFGKEYQVRVLLTNYSLISDTSQIIPLNELTSSFKARNLFGQNSSPCEGQGAMITYTGHAPANASFIWYVNNPKMVAKKDGGIIDQYDDYDGISGIYHGPGPYRVWWDDAENKTITLEVSDGDCVAEATTQIVEFTSWPELDFEADQSACLGQEYRIEFTGGPFTDIQWSFDESPNYNRVTKISGSEEGPYVLRVDSTRRSFISVKVFNEACRRDTLIDIKVADRPIFPFIYKVTVDVASSSNRIVWMDYTDTSSLKEWGLYRSDSSDYENYLFVNYIYPEFVDTVVTVDTHVETIKYHYYTYTDTVSGMGSSRYRLTSIDTCGNESELSAFPHQPIRLTINHHQSENTVLKWTKYGGDDFRFSTYRILRSINGADFEMIAEVDSSKATFADTTLTSYATVAYQVEILNTYVPNEALNDGVFNASRSNIVRIEAPLGLKSREKTLLVFPNPTNDYLNVNPEPGLEGIYTLLNLAGQEMESGILTGPLKIDLGNKANGTYILQVDTDSGFFVRRVVKR